MLGGLPAFYSFHFVFQIAYTVTAPEICFIDHRLLKSSRSYTKRHRVVEDYTHVKFDNIYAGI